MSTVIVGYVASAEGEAAVRQAIVEASLRGANLVLVYSEHSSQGAEAADAGSDPLARARELLTGATVPFEVRHLVPSKDPVGDVLQAADETKAELIVIGIRRRSPVGKLILGSHSQSILLEAPIPVLAVKA